MKEEVVWIYDSLALNFQEALDIGCGGDPKAKTGVDIKEHPEWERLRGQGFDLRVSDMRHLPFKDESFSLVISWHSLEHVPWREVCKTLKEWRRVLRRDGVIVICTPNMESIPRWLMHSDKDIRQALEGVRAVYGAQDDPYDLHRAGFNEALLKAVLQAAGYKDVERLPNPSRDNLVVKAVGGSNPTPELSSMDPSIEVSIVIPTVNTPTLRAVVERLVACTPRICELVFVADTPDEETLKILREYGGQVVVNEGLVGMPVAYNQGIRKARGKYVALVLSDIYVDAYWLQTLLVALRRHPEYGWASTAWVTDEKTRGSFATCSCCLFTREALEDVGLFDEEFSNPEGYGFEDDDLYIRFLLHGYDPHGVLNVQVRHPQSGTTLDRIHGSGEGKQRRFTYNQLLFYRKWGYASTNWNDIPTAYLDDFVDRFQFVRERAKGRILDVGCKESPAFPPDREDVVRVDLDAWRHPNFVRADAHSLPFRADSFDTVVLGEVLEHVESPEVALLEGLRVASQVVFTTPREHEWTDRERPEYKYPRTPQQAVEEQVIPYRDKGLVEVLDEERHPHHRHRVAWTDESMDALISCVTDQGHYGKFVWPPYYGGVLHRPTCIGRNNYVARARGLVLDDGCYKGEYTYGMPGVVGIDLLRELSPQQVEEVKAAWRGKLFVHGDAASLPFRDDAFDTVVASEILEHVWAPITVLRESVRVSRERVLLTVPDEWHWAAQMKPFTHTGHMHYYTLHTFKKLLEEVGDVALVEEFLSDRPTGFAFFYATLRKKEIGGKG